MRAVRCSTLVTSAFPRVPARAPAEPPVVRDAVLAWNDDAIVYAGPASGWEGGVDEELAGRSVIPGFVDCHTHLPFFGWRDDEFEARLAGASYRDLHTEGGIARSARMFAEVSDDEILQFCRSLLREMLEHGTTTLELKTGYGLSVDGELRQARIARQLAEEAPQTATVTLLAGHAVPHGMEREAWVDAACDELIPRAAAEGLIDAVDVYVEEIAFTVGDLGRFAEAAGAAGLPLRCHAEQLTGTRSAAAAVAFGARSADHLNHVDGMGVRALGSADTVAVLLPSSTFLMGETVPPVGELRDAGAAIALATDFNPGTSPVLSMPETIALGCSLYGIPPLEAIAAATANAAWVLGVQDSVGSLEPGKRADFLVLETEDVRAIPYRPGHNPVVRTFVGGAPAD